MDTRNPHAPQTSEAEYQALLDETARKAVDQVGPRTYRITDIDTDPVRFLVLGCHGNGKQTQHNVAALMNQTVADLQASGEPLPSFILFLGDNIYDYGVESPSSKDFNPCFHNVYYDNKMTQIKGIPSFMLLGNHDVNAHGKAIASNNPTGDATGINQAAHTYIDIIPANIQKRAAFYQQHELPASKLSLWNMPYLFYSIIAGNTQIFCLNSSSYLQDYLDLHSGKVKDGKNISTGRVNQAYWFQKEYEKAKREGRQIFIAQHHPLFVSGKRSFWNGFDYNHYITWEQVREINKLLKSKNTGLPETASYNTLLANIFKAQGIQPDLVFAAHEHFTSYYNNIAAQPDSPLRQFTGGGGGGKLQSRASYRGHPEVGLHQQHYGFGLMTCHPEYPKQYELDIFTTEGLHLRFDERSNMPDMEDHADPQVNRLRDCVRTACDRYFNILKQAELKEFPKEPPLELQKKPEEQNPSMFSLSFFTKKITDTWQSVSDASNLVLGYLFHDEKHEKENRIVNDIQAYFSQIQLPELQQCLEQLYALTRELPHLHNTDANAFYQVLQRTSRDMLGMDIENLFNTFGFNEKATPVALGM